MATGMLTNTKVEIKQGENPPTPGIMENVDFRVSASVCRVHAMDYTRGGCAACVAGVGHCLYVITMSSHGGRNVCKDTGRNEKK